MAASLLGSPAQLFPVPRPPCKHLHSTVSKPTAIVPLRYRLPVQRLPAVLGGASSPGLQEQANGYVENNIVTSVQGSDPRLHAATRGPATELPPPLALPHIPASAAAPLGTETLPSAAAAAAAAAASHGHAPEVTSQLVLSPAEAYQKVVGLGVYKATNPVAKTFILAVMAGCYISFSAFLVLAVGGNMPGIAASNPGLHKLLYALIFPVGLLMVILGGADLFTGNTFVVTSAYLEKKISFRDLLKSFSVSYLGNLAGSLLMVAAVTASGVLSGNAMALRGAEYKASLPLVQAVVRGFLANWLVCIAVFHATASSQLTGKAFGLWAPIATFVAIGLEHSVANMFLIPLGIALGAKVTIADFLLRNLIPVTIGNITAGVCCMACVYSVCFGSLGKGVTH